MSLPPRRASRRVTGETASDRNSAALAMARKLVRYGMPVFPARVDENGDPDRDDVRWARWQKYPADFDILRQYRPGDALAAVCGITYDVIDIDPRNGGNFSARRMSEDLGDMGPVVYGRVKTPSGGSHLYVAALGIGSHNNVMPGIDLKGGNPDGTSRGFVFLPPTIRPVKGLDGNAGVISGHDAADRIRMGTYRWIEQPKQCDGDSSSEELTAWIMSAVESQRETQHTSGGSGRESADRLRQACIDAGAGEQRNALLRYVHELERKGYDKADILTLLRSLIQEMPVFNPRHPWYPARGSNPDRELITLLHRRGAVIPDAAPEELAGLDGPSVARVLPSGLTAYSEINRGLVSWLWTRYLADGEVSLLDGDAGSGKSLITIDVAGRVTTGRDMPDGTPLGGEPGAVLLLAPEDSDSTTAGRLEAAAADPGLVFRPAITLRKKRGESEAKAYSGGELISFPHSVAKLRKWILSYNIRLVIVDPIAAFLDEKVNSNNDASVRRALAPVSAMLNPIGCSALFIRHYNKNDKLAASHRGGGSVAFGAVARVQMICGLVPVDDAAKFAVTTPVWGIQQVKNNHLSKRPDHTLAYTIEDSDVVADTDGNMAPRIRWLGEVFVSADELASGGRKTPGPTPMIQEEIAEILTTMFETTSVWDSQDAMRELKAAGITANKETIGKARKRLGVFTRQRRIPGKPGVTGWDWVMPGKINTSDDELP